MKRLLDNLLILEKLIQCKPFGLITDIDGTIAPTGLDILKARVTENNRRYFSILSKKLPLIAVISGRQSQAVKDMVDIENVVCIGHYGMEWWQNGRPELHPEAQKYYSDIRTLVTELEPLKLMEGVQIQDKDASLSIHYRMSPDQDAAKEAIVRLLEKAMHIKKLRVVEDKKCFGILPPVDIDKGTTVDVLIEKYHLHSGIFLGDDTGDISAFKAIRKVRRDFRAFAIAVTNEETPPEVLNEVDFTLEGVKETERLLEWLTEHFPS